MQCSMCTADEQMFRSISCSHDDIAFSLRCETGFLRQRRAKLTDQSRIHKVARVPSFLTAKFSAWGIARSREDKDARERRRSLNLKN